MSRSNQRRVNPESKKQSQQLNFKRIGRILMFSMMLALTASAAVWLNDKWSTKHWDITANADIKAAIEAQLAAMPNKDFISMRPDALRQQWLANIADLQAVHITRILPDHMRIQAVARVPAALWQDEQGQLHLFDERGVAYRLLKQGESPDLPLLRVNEDQLLQVKQMLDAIARLHENKHDQHRLVGNGLVGNKQGNNKAGNNMLAGLSEIRASNQFWQIYFSRGVSWLIPQSNEVNVINHINHFMQQPRWRNRHWRIDARLQSRWFVRPAGHGEVI